MAISSPPSLPSTPPPPLDDDNCEPHIIDPPPPYPDSERERRHRRHRDQHAPIQGSRDPYDGRTLSYAEEDEETNETTPFLSDSHRQSRTGRRRAASFTSTLSAAPSLAQTVLSLFQTDDDVYLGDVGTEGSRRAISDDDGSTISSQRPSGLLSRAAWRRYFRPITVKAYWWAFLHLAVINFPYGLAAWIYLFVFTVTGTILLVALPLGAALCFLNLLGARAFSRGELSLQTRFHTPLSHPSPYPPRPIFTRYREPTTEELETGQPRLTRHGLVRERSFYKNSYAMLTDSTSYQALFYFLVIKPAITLLISVCIVAFGIPAMILVLPAPSVLRAIRKIGIWQANVAVEGLYFAVR